MQPLPSIHLLIVDANHIVRQATAMLLAQQEHIAQVTEAPTLQIAVAQTFRSQPNVILIDSSSDIDAPADYACLELRRLAPKARIVSFTSQKATQAIRAMVSVGIDGITFKHMQTDELVSALLKVASGHNYFPAALIEILRDPPIFGRNQSFDLTLRQEQVLRLMAQEENNRAIANRMGVTEETVRSHVKNILRQLGVSSRTRAVVRGLEAGLLALPIAA